MKKIFKTDIDEDGFVRLPIRVYGPNRKSVRLVGIVDTASSFVIIEHARYEMKRGCKSLIRGSYDFHRENSRLGKIYLNCGNQVI